MTVESQHKLEAAFLAAWRAWQTSEKHDDRLVDAFDAAAEDLARFLDEWDVIGAMERGTFALLQRRAEEYRK